MLVVLPVPATGISVLADILDRASALPVLRAGDGREHERGVVPVAPTDHHLLVALKYDRTADAERRARILNEALVLTRQPEQADDVAQ